MKTRFEQRSVLALPFLLLLSTVANAQDDFSRYQIQARIDTAAKTITASQRVFFTNHSGHDLNEIYFHIYPNRAYTRQELSFILRFAGYFKINPFPGGIPKPHFEIHSIRQNDQALNYLIEGEDQTILKLPLPRPLKQGEKTEVAIDYTVGIPHMYGRFGWHEDIYALARWYPILSVYDEEGWKNHLFYPYHRPFFSESAFYEMTLTVDERQVVIHTGEAVRENVNPDHTKTLDIVTAHPVREFALAMSPHYRLKEAQANGVKIKSFYFAGDEFYAQEAMNDAQGLMENYSQQFGPYPYPEFSLAPVNLGYGGEQMPNLIFLDRRIYQLPRLLVRYFDFLVSHETGHQWFYNLVGVDEFSEMWLEEGVNSHFLLNYLEKKYGVDASVIQWPQPLDWLLPNFSFRDAKDTRYKMIARTNLDRPVVGKLSSFQEPTTIFSLAYGKGSGIVSMLQYILGDQVFHRVFERVFAEYRFRNLSGRQFIRICEEEKKEDLSWFFDQWLLTRKICDYAVAKVQGHTITIKNRGQIQMPRHMQVTFADGTQQNYTLERWDKKLEEFSMESRSPIRKAVLDPQEQLLDIDRTNNIWPRQVRTKFVPLYLDIYDFPIFLPVDSYNLTIGPYLDSGLGIKASLQKPFEWNIFASSAYEFGESLTHSRAGFELKNLFYSQTAFGTEVFNVKDNDGGEEDLAGGKVYLRKELWPAAYGLGAVNDHFTLYLLRNRSLSGTLSSGGLEDARNLSYLQKNEAIIGTALHFGRYGPYPDPVKGYQLDWVFENSGHFLEATQYFYRSSLNWSIYQPVTARSRFAWRLKYGWGYPDDKNLYELGGPYGLRGFDRKSVRGANVLLGSAEYRFPIKDNLKWSFLDHWFGMESIGGVVFFDAGRSWYDDFGHEDTSKDVGAGLRFTLNVGSFLEKAVLRLDVARPIDRPGEETHVWFGVNHAF